MENLDAESFRERIKTDPDAIIIDVRAPEEEIEGAIEGSQNANIMDASFTSIVSELDKSKNYYVFCRSGGRSANACRFMEQNGLNAFNLEGGIQAWNQLQ